MTSSSETNNPVQIFGVTNYDDYWKKRKERNRTYKTDIHRILVELVKKHTPAQSKVLDLGVGPGHLFKELQQSHFDMYGVEISDEAFTLYDFPTNQIAKHDLQQGIPHIPAKPFRTIIASHIIHHMRDPLAFMKQAWDNTAPGGNFIVATQNISFILYRLRFLFLGEFPQVSFGHINFISPYEYEKILTGLGFKIIDRRTTGSHTWLNRIFPFWFSGTIFWVCRKPNNA